MTLIRKYLVDTSYFNEWYRVGKDYTDEGHERVKEKFEQARKRKDHIYVPLPVLFELANHIADVKDSSRRKELAKILSDTVALSLEKDDPWILTPPGNPESINELMAALGESTGRFAKEFSEHRLGLTDTVVIMEAERLSKRFKSSSLKQYKVHIWTRHKEMKAREPDAEPDPFV